MQFRWTIDSHNGQICSGDKNTEIEKTDLLVWLCKHSILQINYDELTYRLDHLIRLAGLNLRRETE